MRHYYPGDPDVTVPLDSSSASASSDQYSTLDLNLPTTGPVYAPVTTLANGTTVTLTLDSNIAQLVDVYDADPTQGSANLIAGVDAGTASYT